VTLIDGIPVTTLERTLFDLAGAINEKRADRAIENVLARRRTTVERLWDVWADLAAPHRPGMRVMRKLLLKRGPGYVARESELEIRFSELLDTHGIEQPDWQVQLGDDDFIGRVDCLFRRPRLIVELDGRIGHVGVLDEARDAERDKRLRALGFRVRRFTWEDVVLRPGWVVSELRKELRLAA
jgi:very-short-patch-repair endonuclease